MKNKQNQDNEDIISNDELGYFVKVIPTTIITIPIDEPIRESRYYRQVVSGISELDESDEIHFKISSPGGQLVGLEALLSAIRQSPATSVAFIEADCHSAASMLALNCDAVSVSDFGNMLVHFVSFGSVGPSNHVIKHAEHIRKTSEKLFRETYQYFLTEEEITKCVEDDYQLWLDADQIMQRFDHRITMLQELHEDHQDLNGCEGNCQCGSSEPNEPCQGCSCDDELDEDYDCENCPGESCNAYEGCTASIDATDFNKEYFKDKPVAMQ